MTLGKILPFLAMACMVFLAMPHVLAAQTQPTGYQTLIIDKGPDGLSMSCGFTAIPDEVTLDGRPTPEFQAIVDKVISAFPDVQRATKKVHVFEGQVAVAAVFVHQNDAFLVYNPVDIEGLRHAWGIEAVWAVVAHELSHIFFDDWQTTTPRIERERRADINSGRFLQFLDVPRDFVTKAIDTFAAEDATPEYPSKRDRKSDALKGWNEYCEISKCYAARGMTDEQKRLAENNIVVHPYDVYPETEAKQFAGGIQKLSDALRLLMVQYTSQIELPKIDPELNKIGYVTASLGAGVTSSNPITVYEKGAELNAIALILGQAQVHPQRGEISLHSSFFIQGDGNDLTHEEQISSSLPTGDVAPFLIAGQHLDDSWPKLAVLSRVARLLSDHKSQPDEAKRALANALATSLRNNMQPGDPLLDTVDSFLTKSEP